MLLLRGIYIVKNNQLIVNYLVILLETEEIALQPANVHKLAVLVAYDIVNRTERIENNAKKEREINVELERVTEIKKERLITITLQLKKNRGLRDLFSCERRRDTLLRRLRLRLRRPRTLERGRQLRPRSISLNNLFRYRRGG